MQLNDMPSTQILSLVFITALAVLYILCVPPIPSSPSLLFAKSQLTTRLPLTLSAPWPPLFPASTRSAHQADVVLVAGSQVASPAGAPISANAIKVWALLSGLSAAVLLILAVRWHRWMNHSFRTSTLQFSDSNPIVTTLSLTGEHKTSISRPSLSCASWRLSPRTCRRSIAPLRLTPQGPTGDLLIPPQHPDDVGKYTIVLDMDETLLTSLMKPPLFADPSLRVLQLTFSDGSLYSVVRPGARELVASLTSVCEVVLWTAGIQSYAQQAMAFVDDKKGIRHNVYRSPAWLRSMNYFKDLRRLGRPMDRILLVDNSPMVCIQPENAIVVDDFFCLPDDDILPRLQRILAGLVASGKSVPDYLHQCAKDGHLVRQQQYYCLHLQQPGNQGI